MWHTHTDIHTYIHTSSTSCASTFIEPCTYTPFHQCTCRRRSCSCCHISRRLRSSLGSQTQWLTRLAKFNMGVSIYPNPTKQSHTHTCIRTKRTEREERWEDKSDYNWRRRVRTGSNLRMKEKQKKENKLELRGDTHRHTALLKSLCGRERHTHRSNLYLLKEMMRNIRSENYAANFTSS